MPRGVYDRSNKPKGRKEKVPNLKKDGENFINQFGVVFTSAEKKHLEAEVQKAYRKRTKLLKMEGELDWLIGGEPTGNRVSQLQLMGRESDVVIAKRSKSLQRFKSREEFDKYVASLHNTNRTEYLTEKMEGYREGYIKALEHIYGKNAAPLINHIKNMNINQYMKTVMQSDEARIQYNYEKGKNNQAPALELTQRAFGLYKGLSQNVATWDNE